MIAVTRIHFASTPPRATEWGRCPECVAWYTANRAGAALASSGLMFTHDLNETQALAAFMQSRHEREHDPGAPTGE